MIKKQEESLSEDYRANLKRAETKMEKVLLKWFMEDPVMLESHSLFVKMPSKNQNTIGIDTRSKPPIIKFNPNFINLLSQERLESVMAQEGLKILLKHPTTRLCKPRSISALSSNVTVVPMSLGNMLKHNNMEDFYPSPEQFGLPKEKCFEEYFRLLMDRQDETNETIKKIWNSMSDEEKQEKIKQAMNNAKQQQEQQEGDGEGQGDKDQDGFKQFQNPSDAMKDYYDPNSTNNLDWGESPLLDADIKNIVENNKQNIKQWGSHTGDLYDQIVSAHTPKISWKEIVRRFNKSVLSMRRYCSRMKLNRRYDLSQPGHRREYDTNIIFAIDASGSMSNDDLAEGFAVINSLCGHAKITYILFDTEIKHVAKDIKKAKEQFKIYGRGGTDFQDVIDYANDHKADGLIIFTDGYASEPTKPLTTKVLWLLHSKDQNLKPPVDWGYVAHLERYE